MKSLKFLGVLMITFITVIGCSSSTTTSITDMNDYDKKSLLFMLEEEKMARDVYEKLYAKWEINQFYNIKQSEQTHMDRVETLLKRYNLPYSILERGKFQNVELQKMYNDLIAKGLQSPQMALQAGAAIEDVDIYDLQRLRKETKNMGIINAYNFLECAVVSH